MSLTKIKNHAETTGQLEGEACKRDGCQGVIVEAASEGCSCHISPPCSSCTTPREYCPECDWRASDDEVQFNDFMVRPANPAGAWSSYRPRPLDPTRLDWRSKPHSNSSMIKEGVFPHPMTQSDVQKAVIGTFGGRFQSFREATAERPGAFTYIAYTD